MDTKKAEEFLGKDSGTNQVPSIQFGQEAAMQESLTPNPPQPPSPSFLGNLSPRQAEENFRSENAAPGVPLDIESGVSAWESLMLEFRRNQENQIKYLENKYGPNTVRFSKNGELIVRMPDPEEPGKVKDLLVNPHTMKGTDFIDLLATVPEVAASIYAMRKGEKIPWLGTTKNALGKDVVRGGALGLTRNAVTGAIGGEAAGAIKDVAANVYDLGNPKIEQTISERAGRVPAMTAIGLVGGGVPSLWKYAKNPVHGQRGPLQFDAIAAQKYFKDKFGIDIPLTIGQSTGSPLFGRSEVFIEKMPGGSGPVRNLAKTQEENLRKLQQIFLGGSLPTEEQIGQQAIAELRPGIASTVVGAETARKDLAQTAQNSIENTVGRLTAPSKELYNRQTGAAVRAAVIAKRDAAKQEADRLFGIVNSLPGGQGKVFDGSSLQTDLGKILNNLPSPEQTVTVPTGLLNAFGRPITTTTTKSEVLREFVPPNVKSRLESVVSLKSPKFSLSDLQQMRREVYDDIAKGEGVPGLGTHYLADIGKALTKAIDDGISSLPTGDLKKALVAANSHYKNKVVPFNRIGLTELFRNADEAGNISDPEVITKLFSGSRASENWKLIKETIGSSSAEFDRMRRSVADTILENSRLPGETTLDAKSLIRNIYNFKKDYREIADDVFKGQEGELFRQARFLKYSEGDKLNEQALRDLLASGSPTAAKLRALIDAEKQQDTLYKNQIMKAVGDGSITQQTINPSEFLNRMIDNKGVGVSEIEEVMKALGAPGMTLSTGGTIVPPVVEDIRRKTFEKLFRDAARGATANDVNLIMAGDPTHIFSGTRIATALKDKDFRLKIKAILGDESYKDLDQYVKLQAATEMPEQSFRSAGGLAAGTQVAKAERILESGGILSYVGNVGRSFLFSYMLSNPATRKWLTNVPSDPAVVTAFLHTLISSPQFLEAVSREFPKAPGMQFIHNLKLGMDRSVEAQQRFSETQGQPTSDTWLKKVQDWESFLGPSRTVPKPTKTIPIPE